MPLRFVNKLSSFRTVISKNLHSRYQQRFQRAWALTKFPLAVTTLTSTAFVSYTFYECNFDIKTAISRLSKQTRQFCYFVLYAPPSREKINTELIYATDLPTFLYDNLASFFLRLDAANRWSHSFCMIGNGVRISDILLLLEKAGVSLDHQSVKNFIRKGNGRHFEEKKFSGCSLQDVLELFGEIYNLSQTSQFDSTFLSNNFSKKVDEAIDSERKSLKLF